MRFSKLIVAVFLASLLLQGCGGRPAHKPTPVMGIALQDICSRYNVLWQWDGVTQVVMLEYKGNKAKALVGSNVVLLGKDKVLLSAPLRREKSIIYVPEDFEAKVIGVLGAALGDIGSADLKTTRIRSVMIDAGHGGKDPGAIGANGVTEKEVVLDISKRLRTLLESAGLEVIMTRDSDEFISLAERTELASKSKADLFISIHANANNSRKIQGLESYYVKTQSKKDLDEEQRLKNEKLFVNRLQANKEGALVGIVADMMYHLKVAQSAYLAQKIADRVTNEMGMPNRGHRSCRFFVVRNTLVPAVLIETGFLSNAQEERKLKTSAYRQKLAETIARSIIEYATH